jgi:hypothetical protein
MSYVIEQTKNNEFISFFQNNRINNNQRECCVITFLKAKVMSAQNQPGRNGERYDRVVYTHIFKQVIGWYCKSGMGRIIESLQQKQKNTLSRASLVGLSGLEPLTSRLSVVRSSQLSYRPIWSG